jgi:hypothetical protein
MIGSHYCNQVIDPGMCCPTAHGANESECTCSSWWRVVHNLPGATAEGYFQEVIRWAMRRPGSVDEMFWKKIFINWDAYQIGQAWMNFEWKFGVTK